MKKFLDIQGQLTLLSVVESGNKSKTSKLLWLFLLPARMKKIHSKVKGHNISSIVSL